MENRPGISNHITVWWLCCQLRLLCCYVAAVSRWH